MFADIDDMKSINDTYGHESGDLALQFTADKLRNLFQNEAFIMRYGGDEFLVISSIPLCDTDFINSQYAIESSEKKISNYLFLLEKFRFITISNYH